MSGKFSGLIFSLSPDFKITSYFASELAELYRPPQEFIDRPIDQVLPPDLATKILSKLQQAQNSTETVDFEYSLFINNREQYFLAHCIPCKNENGALVKFLVTVDNISEQKENERSTLEREARYSQIFNSSQAGIVYGKDSYVLECNQAFLDILELEKETLKNLKVTDFTHPEDRPREQANWQQLLQGEKDMYRLKKRYITASGNVKWVDTVISMIREEDLDEGPKYVGIVNEITNEIELQQELEESIRSKDLLLSIVGHDLRGSVGSVINLAELAEESADKNELKEYLNFIRSASKSSLELLENLLDWGRAKSSLSAFNGKKIQAQEIISEAISQVKSAAQQKGISIEQTIEEPAQVYGDRYMLTTILRNFLVNAIKYSHAGGAVNVQAFQKNSDCHFLIIDQGVGMDESTQGNLFHLSKNSSLPGTNNEKGSGLGLLVCSEFVQRHHGSIQVQSELEKGTTVEVIIPQDNTR